MSAPYTSTSVYLDEHCGHTPTLRADALLTQDGYPLVSAYVEGDAGGVTFTTRSPSRMRAFAAVCIEAAEKAEAILAGGREQAEEVAAS